VGHDATNSEGRKKKKEEGKDGPAPDRSHHLHESLATLSIKGRGREGEKGKRKGKRRKKKEVAANGTARHDPRPLLLRVWATR